MLINFYYISNKDKSKIYVGSTKKPLEVRLSEHIISHYNAKYKNKNKLSSFYIIDGDYFKINLIESLECIDNKMKLQREQEYINKYSGINKNKSYSKFNQLSKDSWNQYQREYYNSTQYKDYKKNYYKKHRIKLLYRRLKIKLLKELPFY